MNKLSGLTRTRLTISEIIILLAIGLYVANFMNKGVYLSFIFLPYLIWHFIYKEHSKRFLVMSSLLFIFSIYYAVTVKLFGYIESWIVFSGYLFSPIAMYFLGYVFIKKNKTEKTTYYMIYVTIVSAALFGALCLYKTITSFGNLEVASRALNGRLVISIWGENLISATGLNTFVSLGIALAPIAFLKKKGVKHSKLSRFSLIILSLISMYTSIQLGNRTGILILLVSILSVFIYTTKFSLKKSRTLLLMLFLGAVGITVFNLNILGVKDTWESTLLSQRLQESSATDDPRFLAWEEAFWGVFAHPLGGRETHLSLPFAHNLWLDVGYDAGLIPFIILVIFSIMGGFSVKKFLTYDHPVILKGLIISSFTAFLITFFLEPIMQGWFYYFTVFCLFLGIIHKHIYINESEH